MFYDESSLLMKVIFREWVCFFLFCKMFIVDIARGKNWFMPGHCNNKQRRHRWRYRNPVRARSVTFHLSLLPAEATTVFFSASSLRFCSLCQHDNSWNVALSLMKFCTTTCTSLLNIEIIGQSSRSHEFICVFFCVCVILLEPVGLDSRNVAQAFPAGST